MKSAWFLTISLTLHAAALVYFIALHEGIAERPIAVAILPIEPETGGANRNAGNDRNDAAKTSQPGRQVMPRKIPTEQRLESTERGSEFLAHPSAIEVVGKTSETNLAHAPARAEITYAAGSSGSASNSTGASGLSSTGTGTGIGQGRGAAPRALITAPARYSDTPKPAYPESARREGREGRVLLRVMIDEQGKTKTAEVNRSSGSDALDQAALDAIKRWRFHPARADDKPVESWVNIPIDFRLTDAKN